MRKDIFKKTLVLGSIFLFFGFITTPNIIGSNSIDDSTPPITTIYLDPSEPNGLNGWYVSNINITLIATDDISGVKTIYYKLPGEEWKSCNGDFIIIAVDYDCLNGIFEYYSEDNSGNLEPVKSYEIYIDQKKPIVEITYEVGEGDPWEGWELIFTTTATDDCSGIDRVEFYRNDALKDTVYGLGPYYIWKYRLLNLNPPFTVMGLILNSEITDDYVNFFAIFVMIKGSFKDSDIYTIGYDKAGNYAIDEIANPCIYKGILPGIYILKKLSLPNNYQGHISNFFIWAEFLK